MFQIYLYCKSEHSRFPNTSALEYDKTQKTTTLESGTFFPKYPSNYAVIPAKENSEDNYKASKFKIFLRRKQHYIICTTRAHSASLNRCAVGNNAE
jgi:hypothetical protein